MIKNLKCIREGCPCKLDKESGYNIGADCCGASYMCLNGKCTWYNMCDPRWQPAGVRPGCIQPFASPSELERLNKLWSLRKRPVGVCG